MILEKVREYTINMGDYESVKIGARVSIASEEADKLLPSGQSYDDLIQELLNDALAADVKYYSELSRKGDSFIHTVDADINGES